MPGTPAPEMLPGVSAAALGPMGAGVGTLPDESVGWVGFPAAGASVATTGFAVGGEMPSGDGGMRLATAW